MKEQGRSLRTRKCSSLLHSLLQYDPSSLGDQRIVTQTVNDNAPVTLLNDIQKHGERRWQTSITIGKDVNPSAFGPGLVDGCVDSFLYVFAVEIDRGLRAGECPTKKILSTTVLRGTFTTSYGKPRTSHRTGCYK